MDTKLKDLIINEVTEEKLKELEDNNEIPPNELFVTEDEDDALIIDEVLDANSENPVANKAVTEKFNEIEPSIQFVENEIQKSKNLFNINGQRLIQGGHTFVSGNTITVAAGGSTETDAVFGLIPVKENTTYYIGANASKKRLLFRIYDENKNVITSAIPNWIYNQYWQGSYADFPSTEIRTQLTIPQGAKYLALQTAWLGSEQTFSNVIVSEYADVADYQPYNGAIVHEKEVTGLRGTVLWENPDPTVDFSSQTLTLSSADYDYLELYYKFGTTYNIVSTMKTVKGYECRMFMMAGTSNGVEAYYRDLIRYNDTSFRISTCFKAVATTESETNAYIIPIKIVGYKG